MGHHKWLEKLVLVLFNIMMDQFPKVLFPRLLASFSSHKFEICADQPSHSP
jgi:hypothetical protein